MAFYLKPPRGSITFHILKECVNQRLTCYDNIYDENVAINSFECLLEDTTLDRSGHFLFRLAAASSYKFSELFLQAEVKLFQKRLECYSKDDIKYFLKSHLRQVKDCNSSYGFSEELYRFYSTLQDVCFESLNRSFGSHVCSPDNAEIDSCSLHQLEVPFVYCGSLVASRSVDLKKGFAIISCKLWKQLLMSLFETYLLIVLKEMRFNPKTQKTLQDERVTECLKLIQQHFFSNKSSGQGVSLSDVSAEVNYFPLCMKNLYEVLKKNHRLSHEARFELSLYLKCIGMSLEDSIAFWEEEYTKDHTASSKCSHDWHHNRRKYVYSIRHLYGLEGSRRNYSMRSCGYLQGKVLSATDEGGCPFKHFDDSCLRRHLKNTLQNNKDVDEEVEVILHKRKHRPSAACKLFYDMCLIDHNGIVKKDDCKFSNPVEYFFNFKDSLQQELFTSDDEYD